MRNTLPGGDLLKILMIVLASYPIATSNRNETIIPHERIIGGEFTKKSEFKYIVSLRWMYPYNPHFHHGGGSIISPYWILTARHALIAHEYFDDHDWRFNFTQVFPTRVLPKFKDSLKEMANMPQFDVEKTFCHRLSGDVPYFPSDSDVGLIKLKYPIPLGKTYESNYNLQKVRLIEHKEDVDWKQSIRIAGWGRYGRLSRQLSSDKLRKTKIHLKSEKKCSETMYRPNQQLCGFSENKSACFGDSGGPGVLKSLDSGEDIQVGIISYVSRNCTDKTYFMSVYHYKHWIDYIMETENESYECEKLLANTHNQN